MTAVITDGVEHLQGSVTFLNELGHRRSGQTGTLSILESIVGIDTNVLRLTKVIGQSDTFNRTEVLIIVAVVVGVRVSTSVLYQLNQVTSLLVVSRCADSGRLVESLLEAQLIVSNTLGLQVGVSDRGNLTHIEVAQVVCRPTRRGTTGDNVIASLELRLVTDGEGECDTRHSDNLRFVAFENAIHMHLTLDNRLLTSGSTVRRRPTGDTAHTVWRSNLRTGSVIPVTSGVTVTLYGRKRLVCLIRNKVHIRYPVVTGTGIDIIGRHIATTSDTLAQLTYSV